MKRILLLLITIVLCSSGVLALEGLTATHIYMFDDCSTGVTPDNITAYGQTNLTPIGTIFNTTGINGCARGSSGGTSGKFWRLENATVPFNWSDTYPFTVSYWVYTNGTIKDTNPEAMVDWTTRGSLYKIYIHRYNNRTVIGSSNVNTITTSNLEYHNWVNIIAVKTDATHYLIYYNGALQGNNTDSYNTVLYNYTTLRLLADTDNTRGFNGIMDEVYFFKGQPSTNDILQLSNSSNPLAFYPFSSASSTPAINITSGYPDNITFLSTDNVTTNFTVTNINYPVSSLNYTMDTVGMDLFTNLTLWYQFNNNTGVGDSGTIVNDVNNNYNGTILNGAPLLGPTSGRYKNALNIAGTDDKVNVSTGAVINGNIFSIALWTYLPDTTAVNTTTNAGYYLVDAGATTNLFCRYYNPSGIVYNTCTVGTTSMGNIGDSSINSYNTWHLTVLTYNSTHAKLYQDGRLLGTTAATFTGLSTYLILGNNLASTRYLSGLIDDVMIWNGRVLTTNEILLLNKSLVMDKTNSTALFLKQSEGVMSTGTHNYSLSLTVNGVNASLSRSLTVNSTAGDLCAYTSGNYNVGCYLGCNITSNIDLGGNNITFNGTGTIQVYANITNFLTKRVTTGCTVRVLQGGKFSG